MSNVGDLVGSHLVWVVQLLMIAERTLGGLVHPEKIEEISVDSHTSSRDWLPVSPGEGTGATCQEDWSPILGQGTGVTCHRNR